MKAPAVRTSRVTPKKILLIVLISSSAF